MYYKSDEFKKKNAELERKYNIPDIRPRDDKDKTENEKNYDRELRSYIPQDVLAAQDKMHILGEQMHDLYKSPKLQLLNRRMTALNDSINSLKNNPYIVGQTESIKKIK